MPVCNITDYQWTGASVIKVVQASIQYFEFIRLQQVVYEKSDVKDSCHISVYNTVN